MPDPIHVALGMMGTDVHSKGLRVLAAMLKDAGFTVTHLGEHLSPQALAKGACDSGAEIVGVSFSSAAYVEHTRHLMAALAEEKSDVAVMVGGLIHADHHDDLQALGVQGIFGPGSALSDIERFVETTGQIVRDRRNQSKGR